jgi:hypothetical protein
MDGRPHRSASAETIASLEPYSGFPLEAGRVQAHVDRLEELLDITRQWDGLRLGYWFADGEFGNTPVPAQYWPRWRSSRQRRRSDERGESGV